MDIVTYDCLGMDFVNHFWSPRMFYGVPGHTCLERPPERCQPLDQGNTKGKLT